MQASTVPVLALAMVAVAAVGAPPPIPGPAPLCPAQSPVVATQEFYFFHPAPNASAKLSFANHDMADVGVPCPPYPCLSTASHAFVNSSS